MDAIASVYRVPVISKGIPHRAKLSVEFPHGGVELTSDGDLRSQTLYWFKNPEEALTYCRSSNFNHYAVLNWNNPGSAS